MKKKIILKCLECGYEQLENNYTDGKRCSKCNGIIVPSREATEAEISSLPKVTSKNPPGLSVNLGIMNCNECQKMNVAMRLYDSFTWKISGSIYSILNFDRETNTILVDEKKLLRLIQLVNPHQKDRPIKLIGGKKLENEKAYLL